MANTDNLSNTTFWAVGATFDKTEDQTDQFINKGIWFDGYSANKNYQYAKLLEKINIGDILLLKSSATKGPGHKTSFTKLKAVGKVLAKTSTYSFTVNWLPIPELPKDFDGISYRKTIEQMNEDKMLQYAKKILDSQPTYSEYVSLLRGTHNLILSGAPGTGKTYLAKQIAAEMQAQTELVQFHPSYDYTDFVEGLRPTDNGNGIIGFERKDGVFKQFCKKALRNMIDSKKSADELQKEQTWQHKINHFINNAIENNTEFATKTGNKFFIIDYIDKSINISIPANEKNSILKLDYDEIYTLLENNIATQNVAEIRDFFKRPHNTQHDSYKYVVCNEIRKIKENTPVSIETLPQLPFVFIIDEINRGEISKIFGELFFALDPGYRGENGRVQTQYQNLIDETDPFKKGFFVPENVYIIGTMNDIDRSVENMDFAFRRRFAWKNILASEHTSMLDTLQNPNLKEKALERMRSLNNVIWNTRTNDGLEGLSAAYHIGASYFLKLNEYDGDFEKLWNLHLEGLLKEYLRGTPEAESHLKKLKNAYNLLKQDPHTDDTISSTGN